MPAYLLSYLDKDKFLLTQFEKRMWLTFSLSPSTSRPFGDEVRKDVRFPNEVDSDQCCACPNGFPLTSKL